MQGLGLVTGQGQGLALTQFKAMWSIIREPDGATIEDVHNLFFYQRGQAGVYVPPHPDWNMHVDDINSMAEEQRAMDAARVTRAKEIEANLLSMFLDIDALEPHDTADMHVQLQGQDVTVSSLADEFQVSKLDTELRLGSRAYPRAYVWAYRVLSMAARNKTQTVEALPAAVIDLLAPPMLTMFETMFPKHLVAKVIPTALRLTEADMEGSDDELDVHLDAGGVDEGSQPAESDASQHGSDGDDDGELHASM